MGEQDGSTLLQDEAVDRGEGAGERSVLAEVDGGETELEGSDTRVREGEAGCFGFGRGGEVSQSL